MPPLELEAHDRIGQEVHVVLRHGEGRQADVEPAEVHHFGAREVLGPLGQRPLSAPEGGRFLAAQAAYGLAHEVSTDDRPRLHSEALEVREEGFFLVRVRRREDQWQAEPRGVSAGGGDGWRDDVAEGANGVAHERVVDPALGVHGLELLQLHGADGRLDLHGPHVEPVEHEHKARVHVRVRVRHLQLPLGAIVAQPAVRPDRAQPLAGAATVLRATDHRAPLPARDVVAEEEGVGAHVAQRPQVRAVEL